MLTRNRHGNNRFFLLAVLATAALIASPAGARAENLCSRFFSSTTKTVSPEMISWAQKVGFKPLKDSTYGSHMSILGSQREVYGTKIGMQLFSMYRDGDMQAVFADLEGQLFPYHIGKKDFTYRKEIEFADAQVDPDLFQRMARRIGVARITLGPSRKAKNLSKVVLESMSDFSPESFRSVVTHSVKRDSVESIETLIAVQKKSLALESPRSIGGRILDLEASDPNYQQVLWFSKHLNDPDELHDAALWLVKKLKDKNLAINKENTLQILEKILVDANWGASVQIPVSVTDINDFRKFILAGRPFHDMSFEGRAHGAETHFFTMAWMVHLKTKYGLQVNLKDFMRSLGQDERLYGWDCLFDDKYLAPGQFTTPGVLTPFLHEVFGLD